MPYDSISRSGQTAIRQHVDLHALQRQKPHARRQKTRYLPKMQKQTHAIKTQGQKSRERKVGFKTLFPANLLHELFGFSHDRPTR